MRKTIRRIQIFLLLVAVVCFGNVAMSADFGLSPEKKADTVLFESDAKLEFIEGVTIDIIGGFMVDPDNVSVISGIVRCDLRTLETGISTRDGHMRDRHLHTDKFPYAFFELTSQVGLPKTLEEGKLYNTAGVGKFFIHGVSREIHPQLKIRRKNIGGGESITVKATFQIRLDDFEIPRPKALLFKLAEVILVDVTFTAYRNVKSDNIVLPDWKVLK
ncbi:MAG: YceI family protein [Candidatus Zixiibacteriota bacterium]